MSGTPILQPLGELEAAVMDHVWSRGEADAKAVHRVVGESRGITLSTIQSTLKRLFKKELLTREKVSHAHIYRPRISKSEFHRGLLDQLVGQLMRREGANVVAAFVDLTERAGVEHLDRLEELVAARRRDRGDSK